MVQTLKTQEPAIRAYVVLRAICIHGIRVEPGSTVQLAKTVGIELQAAGKVAPDDSDAAAKPAKPAKPNQDKKP